MTKTLLSKNKVRLSKRSSRQLQIENELIDKIYNRIKDYRKGDEKSEGEFMSKDHIRSFIGEFKLGKKERIDLLRQLNKFFKTGYVTKNDFKNFLKTTFFDELKNKFPKEKFDTYFAMKAFLKKCYFIRTQPKGKSQAAVLKILGEIYELNLSDCGNKNPICCIYLDDIICTGTALYMCLINGNKGWLYWRTFCNRINKDYLELKKIPLLMVSYANHTNAKFSFEQKKEVKNIQIDFFCEKGFSVYNYSNHNRNTLMASISNQNILECEKNIRNKVTEFQIENERKWKAKKPSPKFCFLREKNIEEGKDNFFENPKHRKEFEKIAIEKSIPLYDSYMKMINKKIEDGKNVKKGEILRARPLGFSTFTDMSFGFGTLLFTWRNVPYNTPMIFWYEDENWIPLFKRKKTEY